MKEIIFLEPIMKEMIWGGHRLKDKFGYTIPSEKTGECWAISAHTNGDCVVKKGTFKGKTLSELWIENRTLFGNVGGDAFPLLVKIIDAKDDLSIQVHPDDSYANKYENGSLGKTECWYILDCEKDGQIIIGHNANTKEEFLARVQEHNWSDLIRTMPIQKGDFFQITPGTVHAIKAGTMILEIQQSSDITYRLYDYDRLQYGKPRELHIEKSMDVITCPGHDTTLMESKKIEYPAATVEELVSCNYYTVSKIHTFGKQQFDTMVSFGLFSVIEGEGTMDQIPIKKGDHFILPDRYGSYEIAGDLQIIQSHI